jgi:hypothetical protein
MEAVRSSETLVNFYRITRRHIQEGSTLHQAGALIRIEFHYDQILSHLTNNFNFPPFNRSSKKQVPRQWENWEGTNSSVN